MIHGPQFYRQPGIQEPFKYSTLMLDEVIDSIRISNQEEAYGVEDEL